MHNQFFATFVLFSIAVSSVLTVNKKSDMSKFTSAINGASRLRYGKRNIDFGYPLPAFVDSDDYDNYNTQYDVYDKRSALSNKFIQSLNEAERLRFGRK